MRKAKLSEMPIDRLVDRFAEITAAQGIALDADEFAKYKRLYGQMKDVDNELRSRGREARLALTRLYGRPDAHVRMQAATMTLRIAPETARAVLKAIVDAKLFPQAGHAGILLHGHDVEGWRPD
jgi:hypothetical protein